MTILTYDFESDTVGNPPDGWTVLSDVGGPLTVELDGSDKRFLVEGSAGKLGVAICSEAGIGMEDILVTGILKKDAGGSVPTMFIRHDGAAARTNLYAWENTVNYWVVYKFVAGASTVLVDGSKTISSGIDQNFKIEATGGTAVNSSER